MALNAKFLTTKYIIKMKKQNTPAQVAAPANAEIEKIIEKYASHTPGGVSYKLRERIRRIRKLAKSKVPPEKIEELLKNEDRRTILCLVYGTYKMEDGTRKKTVTKRDEHHKVVGKEEIEIPNILYGVYAAKKLMEDNKIPIISYGKTYVYADIDKKDVDKVSKLMEQVGRVHIYKWQESKQPVKKDKKPSNNTDEVKKANKAAKHINMKPFYAAKRKGCIDERIKKYNPKLAEQIQKWLDAIPERTKRKNRGTGKGKHGFATAKLQRTTLEIKRSKRIKACLRQIDKLEAIKAVETLKSASNAKKKADKAAVRAAKKEQSLKLAA